MMRLFAVILISTFVGLSCFSADSDQSKSEVNSFSRPEYAKAFDYIRGVDYTLLRIINPENNDVLQRIRVGGEMQSADDVYLVSPPKSVVVLSTTYLAFINYLNETATIQGLSNTELVYSEIIRKKVVSKEIIDVGNDASLNYELLLDLDPDLVFFYDFGPSTSSVSEKLKSLGFNVVLVSEFRETTPLGKTEWIKFFGAIYNKFDLADSMFQSIENQYNNLCQLKSKFNNLPLVFTALPWKGQWYQPGGLSFQAGYFEDAGAQYLWSDDRHVSGINIDKEVVFEKAMDADFWLHPSNVVALNEIASMDSRYTRFESFAKKRVYNNNKRLNNNMGNDYWEEGIMEPHVILKDLMSIFHPELFPDYEFKYYRKLNAE